MKPNTFVIDDAHTYYIEDREVFEKIANYLIYLDTLRKRLSEFPVFYNEQNRYILDSHKIVFLWYENEERRRIIIKTIYIPKGTGEYAAKIMQYLGVYIDRSQTIPVKKRPLLGDPYPKYKTERHRRPIFMQKKDE